MNSFYTTKIDQTHTYDANGKRLFITRLKAEPLTITQVKTQAKDQYSSLQVAVGQKKRINNAQKGHLKNLDLRPLYFREIKLSQDTDKKVGDSVLISEILSVGDLVRVSGKSKGRGFAGVMKRWRFHGGTATHGQTDRERAPGSIGQGTTIGRVFKGKKMAGHMGNVIVTRKGARIVKIDEDKSEIWVTGSVPGPKGNLVKLEKYQHKDFIGLFQTGAEKKAEQTKTEEKSTPDTQKETK